MSQPFCVWFTGPPAAGKTTLARLLARRLRPHVRALEVLESDRLRRVLTPSPRYDEAERNLFYRALAYFASRLVAHGVTVLLDATGHRRAYRELARRLMPRFFEVSVQCAPETRAARDPKGLYATVGGKRGGTLPGLQVAYELSSTPDLIVDTDHVRPEEAVALLWKELEERGWLERR